MSKPFSLVVLFAVVGYAGLAMFYAHERLFWDGSYYFVRLLAEEGFFVQHQRWTDLISQALPVLSTGVLAPAATLQLYSLSLAIPWLALFLIAGALGDRRGLLLGLLLAVLASRFSFFWAISQLYFSLAVGAIMVLVLARLETANGRLVGFLLFAPLFYFAHPAGLALYVWSGLYLFLFPAGEERSPFSLLASSQRGELVRVCLVLAWGGALLVLKFSTLNRYESGIAELENGVGSFGYYLDVLVRYQWVGLLTIAVCLIYLVARRRVWIAVYAGLSSLTWISVTYFLASWAGHFYIEHLVQPAVYFALLAAVLALPERSAEWTAWVGGQRPHLLCVVALSWFALVSLFLVVDMGQEIRQRRQVIAGLLDAAEHQDVGKGEITDAVFLENFIGNAKYLPCISLVHTATERRAPIMLRVALPGVEQQFAESTERALPGSRLFGTLADQDWIPFQPPTQR
jgi:hypothetical protein